MKEEDPDTLGLPRWLFGTGPLARKLYNALDASREIDLEKRNWNVFRRYAGFAEMLTSYTRPLLEQLLRVRAENDKLKLALARVHQLADDAEEWGGHASGHEIARGIRDSVNDTRRQKAGRRKEGGSRWP